MNKYETYFGQTITDDELNEIFGSFSTAIEQFILDYGYTGVASGGELTQAATPNLTVLANGPAVVYDQTGNRIAFASAATINVATDENNHPTLVAAAGQEKWVSVFVRFTSTPSDPREDELGNTVYFRKLAGYEFKVVAGSEAPTGTAPRVALRGDQVLLGDVRLTYGKTSIVTADIDNGRCQTVFDLSGTPLAVKGRGLKMALQQMLDAVNNVGPDTISMPAFAGTPVSLAADTLRHVVQALLNQLNVVKVDLAALGGSVNGHTNTLNGVAKLASDNTYTASNTFNGGTNFSDQLYVTATDAERALLATNVYPTDHAGSPSNKWKAIFTFKYSGGQYARVYTGSNSNTHGGFAIVVNAYWEVAGQRWVARDSALPAVALIWTYKRLIVSSVASGTASWSEWPHNTPSGGLDDKLGAQVSGDAVISGVVYAGSVSANNLAASGDTSLGNVNASGQVTVDRAAVTNDLGVGGAVTGYSSAQFASHVQASEVRLSGTAGVKFNSMPLRANSVGLCSGRSASYFNSSSGTVSPCWIYEDAQDRWVAATSGYLSIPIRLPVGGRLRAITATFTQVAGSNELAFKLVVGRSPTLTFGLHANGEPHAVNGANNNLTVVNLIDGSRPQGLVIDNSRMMLQVVNGNYNAPNGWNWPGLTPAMWLEEVVVIWDDPGPTAYLSM